MGHPWEQRDEAVVAASVEEVWAAIATGPGIDSWFMGRNRVDPGPAGSVTTDVGGFEMTGSVTAWDPPNHFAYRSDGPGERFIAFEYLVEGRDRSSTVLRLITSGFLPDDDWESEFEAMTVGGEMYLRTLIAYLDHFAGRFATPVSITGSPVSDWPATWAALRAGLALRDQPAVGDPVRLAVPGRPQPRWAGRLRQFEGAGHPYRGRSLPVHPRPFRQLRPRPSPLRRDRREAGCQAWRAWLAGL